MSTLYANMGAAAAVIMVLLLRRVLKKKAPAGVFAALWLLVLIRVLIPVEVTSHISVFPAKSTPAVYVGEELEHGKNDFDFAAPQHGAQMSTEAQDSAQIGAQRENTAQISRKTDYARVLSVLHACGTALLAAYFGICHIRMLRRCGGFEHEKSDAANAILRGFDKSGRIALLTGDAACSPFSIGIVKPKIVLPPECKKEQLRCILAHEYVHIRDCDAAVKLVGLAAVCAGWFNPFAWIAFGYLNRDLERFCDERALRLLGAENAPRYALTLLDFAEMQMQSAAQSFAAAPLEERVNDILNIGKRKTSTFLAALTVAAALLAMTACGTAAFAAEAPQAAADEQTAVIKVEAPAGDSGAQQPEIPVKKPPQSIADDSAGVIKIDGSEENSGVIKIDATAASSKADESAAAERKAYRTFDRKWDFYDIYTADYAHPTKYAGRVLWDTTGCAYIYGTKGEDIYATKSGTVKDFDYAGGYGMMLIIEHDDGTAAAYYHLDEVLVDIGDRVEQGDVIATLGTSGNTKYAVCGFEIFENDMTIMHPEENMQDLEWFVLRLGKNKAALEAAYANKK